MENVIITGLYTSLLALFYISLSINVIKLRRSLQIGVGDGENKDLQRAIRVHGNFSEYIPMSLLLLVCFELSGGSSILLHACGGALFVGRVLHAQGLGKSVRASKPRVAGTMLTFTSIIVLAISNIVLFFAQLF